MQNDPKYPEINLLGLESKEVQQLMRLPDKQPDWAAKVKKVKKDSCGD